MGRREREKGSRFERRLAKVFTAWDHLGRSFSRTRGSGSWDKAPGDVYRDEAFAFLIEAKDHSLQSRGKRRWSLIELFSTRRASLVQWWAEARSEAARAGKLPWLVFTSNYLPEFILMAKPVFDVLAEKVPALLEEKYFVLSSKAIKGPDNVVLMRLDRFLALVSSSLVDELFGKESS